jgi:Astacin (Peptidase family M12A)
VGSALIATFMGCSSLPEATSVKPPQLDGVHLTKAQREPTFTETSSTPYSPEVSSSAKSKDVLVQEGWIRHTFSDGRSLTFRNYQGQAMISDDEILAPTAYVPEMVDTVEKRLLELKTAQGRLSMQGAGLNWQGCSLHIFWCWTPTSNYFFPSKTLYFILDSNFSGVEKNLIRESIFRWNASGVNIKFYEGVGTEPFIVKFIRYVTNDFCGRTMIGTQARVISNVLFPDHIDINPNCLSTYSVFYNGKYQYATDATVHHEMGHKVGMPHEQERCDRDTFVNIVNSNGTTGPRCWSDFKSYTLFDFDSIMLYSPSYVTAKPNLTAGTYVGNPNAYLAYSLSPHDIATINAMYP